MKSNRNGSNVRIPAGLMDGLPTDDRQDSGPHSAPLAGLPARVQRGPASPMAARRPSNSGGPNLSVMGGKVTKQPPRRNSLSGGLSKLDGGADGHSPQRVYRRTLTPPNHMLEDDVMRYAAQAQLSRLSNAGHPLSSDQVQYSLYQVQDIDQEHEDYGTAAQLHMQLQDGTAINGLRLRQGGIPAHLANAAVARSSAPGNLCIPGWDDQGQQLADVRISGVQRGQGWEQGVNGQQVAGSRVRMGTAWRVAPGGRRKVRVTNAMPGKQQQSQLCMCVSIVVLCEERAGMIIQILFYVNYENCSLLSTPCSLAGFIGYCPRVVGTCAYGQPVRLVRPADGALLPGHRRTSGLGPILPDAARVLQPRPSGAARL